MKEVLTAKLADFTYSPERASELSREICNELLGRVKGKCRVFSCIVS